MHLERNSILTEGLLLRSLNSVDRVVPQHLDERVGQRVQVDVELAIYYNLRQPPSY